jgi:type I restriction enzyme, S subunit
MSTASATIPVGYKQTEIGVIPEDWEISTLGDISKKITDGTHYTPIYVISGVPFYSVETVTNDDFSKTKFISEEEHQNLIKRCKPERGDILMTRIGTLGITKRIDWDCDASIYVSLCLLKPNGVLDYSYVGEYSKSQLFVKEVVKRSLLGATPKKINMNRIGEIPIIHPSDANECLEIAEVLSHSGAQIQALEYLISKKRDIKQGTMQELLTGKTRLPGFTDEWETHKIGELVSVKTGDKDTQDRVQEGNYPFFVRSQKVERINSYSYKGEAVLTAGDGVGTGKVFHYINGKFDYHQRVYCMSDFSKIYGRYFFYQFSTRFLERIMSMTAKSSVDSVRKAMITEMEIPVPVSINEQEAIAEVLTDMDAEIAALEERLEKAKAIKQGMMQQLLTGKKRLVEPQNSQEVSA